MSIIRRVVRPVVTPAAKAPVASPAPDEITYRGYRIEPESYSTTRTAWSPRVVVSMRVDGGWGQAMPLYSSRAVRFPSREEADRCALEVAKAWIDATVQSRG